MAQHVHIIADAVHSMWAEQKQARMPGVAIVMTCFAFDLVYALPFVFVLTPCQVHNMFSLPGS